ncbi:MAG: hypothetical protein QGG85_03135 [Candidatus Marinimicrobia bacterium]|nr:hypothetical protein [Candidatus Neomarinimicrobiota bacterium]
MVATDRLRIIFFIVNVVGGIAVLGSYAHGLLTEVALRPKLWGGVPEAWRPVYTVNMFLAAGGYFFFTAHFLMRALPSGALFFNRFGFEWIIFLYAAFLISSALWMPLTFSMMKVPSDGTWFAIRSVLTLTGIASVTLLVSLFASNAERGDWLFWAAVAGLTPFIIQTVILDAIIWPRYSPLN